LKRVDIGTGYISADFCSYGKSIVVASTCIYSTGKTKIIAECGEEKVWKEVSSKEHCKKQGCQTADYHLPYTTQFSHQLLRLDPDFVHVFRHYGITGKKSKYVLEILRKEGELGKDITL